MNRVAAVVCIVMIVSGGYAARQYRDFTDVQGRTIRGQALAFDAASGQVKFERDNRKTASVPITVFCAKDQEFIRNGELARIFARESLFRISVKRIRKDNEEESGLKNYVNYDAKDTFYRIELENRSGAVLPGLVLEYCIYYEQEVNEKDGVECLPGVLYGTIDVGDIKPKTPGTYTTESVTLYKAELDSGRFYYSGSGNVRNGDIHGIQVRVSLKVPGGSKETRTFAQPDAIVKSQSWATSSVPVGMN